MGTPKAVYRNWQLDHLTPAWAVVVVQDKRAIITGVGLPTAQTDTVLTREGVQVDYFSNICTLLKKLKQHFGNTSDLNEDKKKQCLTMSGHAPKETTDGVLGYLLLPDPDQGNTELQDSLRCNLTLSDGQNYNVP